MITASLGLSVEQNEIRYEGTIVFAGQVNLRKHFAMIPQSEELWMKLEEVLQICFR